MKRKEARILSTGAFAVSFTAVLAADAQPDATTSNPSAPMTSVLAAQLSKSANHRVIVVMKNQFTGDAATRDQSPVMSEFARVVWHSRK